MSSVSGRQESLRAAGIPLLECRKPFEGLPAPVHQVTTLLSRAMCIMQICKRHNTEIPNSRPVLDLHGRPRDLQTHAFQFQKSPSLQMFLRSEQVVLGLPARRDGSGASFEASSSCQNLHLRDADKVSCPAGPRATQQSKTCAANKLSLRSEVQRLRPTRAPMALQGEGGRERERESLSTLFLLADESAS